MKIIVSNLVIVTYEYIYIYTIIFERIINITPGPSGLYATLKSLKEIQEELIENKRPMGHIAHLS